MKISVVTVTLSADAAFALTRNSVKAQTYDDVEHIVVCAYPPLPPGADQSLLLPPQGVYNALNAGIAKASGDIIGLLHAGDTFSSPDILSSVASAFIDRPDAEYLYGDIRYVNGRERTPGRTYHGRSLSRHSLIRGIYPPHPSLYIRADALQAVGPYSERYRICGDFDMWVRLWEAGYKGAYLPQTMVDMTLGGLSTRLSARLWTNNVEKLKVLHAHNLPANPLLLATKYFSL